MSGMREDELRDAAECHLCKKPFGNSGPIFWRLTLKRMVLDVAAAQRQQGLTMMLGGEAALARVMGANEVMAQEVQPAVDITICEGCAGEPTTIYDLGLSS